jgi:hypothetical protein
MQVALALQAISKWKNILIISATCFLRISLENTQVDHNLQIGTVLKV